MKHVSFPVDDASIEFDVEGETFYGEPRCLVDEDDNLLAGRSFEDRGYVVQRWLSAEQFQQLRAAATALFATAMNELEPGLGERLDLTQYHRRVTDQQHLELIRRTGFRWSMASMPTPLTHLEAVISELCGVDVVADNANYPDMPFQCRVVRPNKPDNNPPHRDVWLDRLRHGLNAYVPVCGSGPRSALPIVPGSHRWLESEIERTRAGALIGGIKYVVPSVTAAKKPIRMTRPSPAEGELMLFTPYTIHGGGRNMQDDITRVSLEMRFWRRGGPKPQVNTPRVPMPD